MAKLTRAEKQAIAEYKTSHKVKKLPDGEADCAKALRKWRFWPLGGGYVPTYREEINDGH